MPPEKENCAEAGPIMGAKEEYKARNAARDARRAEQEEAKKKVFWWFWHPDPVAKFTGWVAIYTGVLAAATIGTGVVLYKTDVTLYDTLLATQRPWVSVEVVPTGNLSIFPTLGLLPVRISL